MALDELQTFKEQAAVQELIYLDWNRIPADDQFHHFDLNSGNLRGLAPPAKIKELVELARTHARSQSSGRHHALLQLVAPRAEVDEFSAGTRKCLFWSRSHHVSDSKNTQRWVTLATWLTDNRATPDIGSAE